jgi:hypothetical protein
MLVMRFVWVSNALITRLVSYGQAKLTSPEVVRMGAHRDCHCETVLCHEGVLIPPCWRSQRLQIEIRRAWAGEGSVCESRTVVRSKLETGLSMSSIEARHAALFKISFGSLYPKYPPANVSHLPFRGCDRDKPNCPLFLPISCILLLECRMLLYTRLLN